MLLDDMLYQMYETHAGESSGQTVSFLRIKIGEPAGLILKNPEKNAEMLAVPQIVPPSSSGTWRTASSW
jgi:hypothetical protein